MSDAFQLGYQAALVSMHGPTYGRLWLSVEQHPGDTVSSTEAKTLVQAAEGRKGALPWRRTDLLREHIEQHHQSVADAGHFPPGWPVPDRFQRRVADPDGIRSLQQSLHCQTTQGLLRWAGSGHWLQVGKNAEMTAGKDAELRHCPYPLDLALEWFHAGGKLRHVVFLHYGPESVTTGLAGWFHFYNGTSIPFNWSCRHSKAALFRRYERFNLRLHNRYASSPRQSCHPLITCAAASSKRASAQHSSSFTTPLTSAGTR